MGRDHGRRPRTGRGAASREEGRRFLVVCEGDTEKAYFHYVRDALHEPGVHVKAVRGKSSDPVHVVERAAAEARSAALAFDQTWAVFDHDGRTDRVRRALDVARAAGVRVALSNPSFEVWLTWHVRTFSTNCDQDSVEKTLKACCPTFVKGTSFDARPFEGLLARAQDRARSSRAEHARAGRAFPDDRPMSDLDLLLAELTTAALARRGRSLTL